LGTAWGLTFTPGPWVNSVRLNKGTGSVVNGYESMVGQIDIALKSPETSDALYVNLYGNTNSRHEGNLILSRKLNDTWSTTLLTHGSRLTAANDFNSDGFYDTPTSQQVSVGNRWQFQTSDWEGQFGVYATSDDRRGGSISFDKEKPQNAQNIYGFEQYTRRIMAWSKTGKVLDEAGDKSFGLQTQWVVHDQQGSFGLKNYTGLQRSAQINAIYQTPISGKAHQLRTGASYLFDETNQTFNDSLMPRTEHVPGVFGEYVFSPNLRWSIVAGMRLDQHNLYGTWFTPRLHARYNANEKWTFRLSSGRGRRVPNLLLEQQTLLTSGRELRFQEGLREEDAWNSGIGVSRQFVWQGRAGQITADFYRTDFINRSVTDFDFSDTLILVRNLVGESRSNAFQIQVQQEVLKNFDVRVAYKYLDVQTTTAGELRPDLLQAVHRGFVNMSYEWRRFEFDGTLHIYGKQRLPLRTSELGNEFPDWAPAFVNINAQINYKVGQWIFFIGSENLSGTRQQIALRGTDQPLSTAFDTSYGWGPLMGPLFYAGLHFSLPQWGDRKGKSN